jgi:hypothetical protein
VRKQFAMRVGRHVVCGFPTAPPGTGANAGSQAASDPPATLAASTSGLHLIRPLPGGTGGLGLPTAPSHVHLTVMDWHEERWRTAATADVPVAELDAGMIVGRVLCFAGARVALSGAVSRPHLLLLRDGGHLFALDLASLNGTRVNGERIRRVRISEEGAAMELGKRAKLIVDKWSVDVPPWGAA